MCTLKFGKHWLNLTVGSLYHLTEVLAAYTESQSQRKENNSPKTNRGPLISSTLSHWTEAWWNFPQREVRLRGQQYKARPEVYPGCFIQKAGASAKLRIWAKPEKKKYVIFLKNQVSPQVALSFSEITSSTSHPPLYPPQLSEPVITTRLESALQTHFKLMVLFKENKVIHHILSYKITNSHLSTFPISYF